MGRINRLAFAWVATLSLIAILAILVDNPTFLTAGAFSLLGSATSTTVFILKGE